MIPDLRRKEILAWLDDQARDYSLSNREIALARDAAALIRERDAAGEQWVYIPTFVPKVIDAL